MGLMNVLATDLFCDRLRLMRLYPVAFQGEAPHPEK
jgi:hypothetical protein